MNSWNSCAASVLLCESTSVGRLSAAITLATENVFPEPVTPSSVCAYTPASKPATSFSTACAWSPASGNGASSSNARANDGRLPGAAA